MPINKLYHPWIQRISELRPNQRITQVRGFVWMMVGIYSRRSVYLSRIAGKIPGTAKLLSTVRRLSRLLSNSSIRPREWYEPIVAPDEEASKRVLTEELEEQIEGVHCVLVIAGMYARHSYWIGKELDLFVRMEKPIIGIAPWGQEQLPRVVQDVATEMVVWNTESIVEAIRKHAL